MLRAHQSRNTKPTKTYKYKLEHFVASPAAPVGWSWCLASVSCCLSKNLRKLSSWPWMPCLSTLPLQNQTSPEKRQPLSAKCLFSKLALQNQWQRWQNNSIQNIKQTEQNDQRLHIQVTGRSGSHLVSLPFAFSSLPSPRVLLGALAL